MVVAERAAAGRAPRGGRCHGAEYGPGPGRPSTKGPYAGSSRLASALTPWVEGESFLRANGVDVIPLVDAELNRRLPGRADRSETREMHRTAHSRG